ncbi:putative chromatin SPT2 [Helianthus annuus]|uniref:Chromatin SPT2 n=1 Tax=Helianthus annuus TaxID=4232 RepID=A0A9K3HFR1_HELAN|nr:protein SPT2 homolog isoform X2 [Helianthus annuus]KAF5777489.1 putative chromatin SPT2 [Helianthus annuus]KAJ0504894.1 putative chromatin SPT2 [Helianthus annuus]KAJ0863530.1 putative chromatin SPT2 [Helianthus annuus]
MAEYDLDEYEDYEDDVGEYEDEGGEYEEEEEEEERLPTQEEMEYLELRQKLKESIRKKMKKDPGSGIGNSLQKKSKMPYDNFGSFFGPSQPVIAQRVIQESKSLLENPHLAERISKAKTVQNKGGSSTTVVSKPRPNGQQPQRVNNMARPKAKIQMLKNTRDYSFLLSDDAELPVPQKIPPKSVPPPKPENHSSQRQSTNSGRKVINGHHEERKPLPTSSQTRPKPGQQSQRPSTSNRLPSTSSDSRKQVSRNEGSGPGRPSGQKPVPSKMAAVVNKSKAISPLVSRGSVPTGHKPQSSRPPPSSLQKKPLEHKKDDRRPATGNIIRKPVVSSKPQIKQQLQKQQLQKQHLQKKKQVDDKSDDDEAINMIRNMFGYNPNRYRNINDDDDSDMEAGFDDIMMEEKRSARIAAKEDEEELKKIEEEERRERMRKAAKKRKLSQR